jgi:hypothetical protein
VNVVLQKLSLARLPGKRTDSWLPLRQWPPPPSTSEAMLQLAPAVVPLTCMRSVSDSCVALALGAEFDKECCRMCVADAPSCCGAPPQCWHGSAATAMFGICSRASYCVSSAVLRSRLAGSVHFVPSTVARLTSADQPVHRQRNARHPSETAAERQSTIGGSQTCDHSAGPWAAT